MPEILDSVLNEETLNMLDKHQDTLDKVSSLLSKVDSITSNPLLEKVSDILLNYTQAGQQAKDTVIDPWAISIFEKPGTPTPVNQEPVRQSLQPETQPPARSNLHAQYHEQIDNLTEQQLQELLQGGSTGPEPGEGEPVDTTPEPDEVDDPTPPEPEPDEGDE